MIKTQSLQREVVLRNGTKKFLDFVELNGKFQTIWTEDLSRAVIVTENNKEKIIQVLDSCGDLEVSSFINITVTLKVEI